MAQARQTEVARHWCRLYDSVLDDPKMQKLPPGQFKTLINLWCLASSTDGVLPPLDDVAFRLRMDHGSLVAIIGDLQKAGLIDKTEAGLEPHNWRGRQFKADTPKDSYVYVIGAAWDAPVKIGFSKNPWARLQSLQTNSPVKLSVLAAFRCRATSEVDIHNLLAEWRREGEWFELPLSTTVALREETGSYEDLVAKLRSSNGSHQGSATDLTTCSATQQATVGRSANDSNTTEQVRCESSTTLLATVGDSSATEEQLLSTTTDKTRQEKIQSQKRIILSSEDNQSSQPTKKTEPVGNKSTNGAYQEQNYDALARQKPTRDTGHRAEKKWVELAEAIIQEAASLGHDGYTLVESKKDGVKFLDLLEKSGSYDPDVTQMAIISCMRNYRKPEPLTHLSYFEKPIKKAHGFINESKELAQYAPPPDPESARYIAQADGGRFKMSQKAAPPRHTDAQWTVGCKILKEQHYWNDAEWGPRPGTPGCLVPEAIQIEYGFLPPKAGGGT